MSTLHRQAVLAKLPVVFNDMVESAPLAPLAPRERCVSFCFSAVGVNGHCVLVGMYLQFRDTATCFTAVIRSGALLF